MAGLDQNQIELKLAEMVRDGFFRGETVELQGVSFKVEKPYFWKDLRNAKYMSAEVDWYDSTSPFVRDLFEIYGTDVAIWKAICDSTGQVNSNYGRRIYDTRFGCQYYNAVKALKDNWLSRQAIMIYQDPWMHQIAGKDFTCTNTVQYFMNKTRDGFDVDAHVYMRSNDAIFGFNNDYHWQNTVLRRVAYDLDDCGQFEGTVRVGNIYWHAASFHVYERHFDVLTDWLS